MPQVAHHPHHFASSASRPLASLSCDTLRKACTKVALRTGHGASPYSVGRRMSGMTREKKRSSCKRRRSTSEADERDDEVLAALDGRLTRLEQRLQNRFSAAGLSLFSPPSSPGNLPSPPVNDIHHVSEGVQRICFSPSPSPSAASPSSSSFSSCPSPPTSSLSAPPPQRVFGAIYIPDHDSAPESVSALYEEESTFFFNSNSISPSPSLPSSASSEQGFSRVEEEEGVKVKMAQLLCGMRRKEQFASMSLFPELSSASIPALSSYASSLYPSFAPSPSLSSSHIDDYSAQPSPAHTPYFSPASPASSDGMGWYSKASTSLPHEEDEKEEVEQEWEKRVV